MSNGEGQVTPGAPEPPEPGPTFEIELSNVLPLERLYRDREHGRLEAEQKALIVDISEEGLAATLEQGRRAQPPKPQPAGGTGVNRAEQLKEPTIRQGVSTVLKTLTGLDLDTLEQHVRAGTLPEAVSLKLLDPVGQTMEAVARQTAEQSGLAPELVEQVGTTVGLLAGILFPWGSAKRARNIIKGRSATPLASGATTIAQLSARDTETMLEHARLVQDLSSQLSLNPEGIGEGAVVVQTMLKKLVKNMADTEDPALFARLRDEVRDVLKDNMAFAEELRQLEAHTLRRRSAQLRSAAAEGSQRLAPPTLEDEAVIKGLREALTGQMATANINVARVQATAGVKDTMRAVNALQAERLAQARKTVTHAQTIEESQRLGMTLEQAAGLDVANLQTGNIRATQMALRDYHNTAARYTEDLMRRALKGDQDAMVEINYAFTLAGDLSVRDELLGKAIARGLEARKIASLAERAPFSPEQLMDLAARLGGDLPADRTALVQRGYALARRLEALSKESRRDVMREAIRGAREGRANPLFEAWLNWGLLSSPATHIVNTLSNTGMALWAPGQRVLAATWDMGLTGAGLWGERSVYMGEAAAMLFGLTMAQRQAVIAFGRALKTGVGGFGPDKVELGLDASRRVMVQEGVASQTLGFWSAAYRAPTRMLTAEDAYFKTLNYQAELFAQAYREAAKGPKAEFAATVARIVKDPPDAVRLRAQEFALVQTFNQELSELGWIGRAAGKILGGIREIPVVGKLVAPFVRTPTNLMHYASEITPFLNAFSDTLRVDLVAGGDRRALALAKITSGALLAWGVMELSAAGLIVGGGPRDPVAQALWRKQDGRLPYSLKIGGEWVQLNRLDPLAITMFTVADAMDILSNLPEGSPLAQEIGTALTLSFSRNMVSKTYLQGISDLFESLQDPQANLLTIPKSLARTLSPAFLRSLERRLDPAQRETRVERELYDEFTKEFERNPWAEVQELLNAAKAGIPGWSDTLPPSYNRFGDVVVAPPGVGIDGLSPIYATDAVDDPVAKELRRIHAVPHVPRPVIFGRERPRMEVEGGQEHEYAVHLNPWETARLRVLAGKGSAAGPGEGGVANTMTVPAFRDALAALFQRADYRQAGDAGKRLIVDRLDQAYKDAARAQLMEEYPGLQDMLRRKLELRGEAISGQPARPATPGGLAPSLGR